MKIYKMALNKVKFNLLFFKFGEPCKRFRSTATILNTDIKNTIEQDEVKKLSKLSPQWWDEKGDMRALHSMNKLRVQLVRDSLIYINYGSMEKVQMSQPLKNFKILDVGCGGGILSEPLARIGAHVTGLDASSELIEIAKDHASKDPALLGHINYICGSIEEEAEEKKGYYDAVVASEVLEHVVEKDLFLESCSNSLKPGGSIFITTINKTMLAWVAGVMSAEYVLHLVPKETHDWDKFVTPQQVQYTLEKHGCYTKLVHGMFYNFICNEWFWTPNADINYALHAVKKK